MEYKIIGYKNNDDSSIFFTQPQLKTNITNFTKVGLYPISFIDTNLQTLNYKLNYNTNIYTISKRNLLISIKDTNINYGDTISRFNYTYIFFVNNDKEQNLNEIPIIVSTATTQSLKGEYVIFPKKNYLDSNYTLKFENGKLTINPILPKLKINLVSTDNGNIIYEVIIQNAGGELIETGSGYNNISMDSTSNENKLNSNNVVINNQNFGYYYDTIYNARSAIYFIKAFAKNSAGIAFSNTLQINYLNKSEVKLYPNPNDGNFTLMFSKNLIGNQANIYNVMGEIVHSFTINNDIINLQLSNSIESGTYYLKVAESNVTKFSIKK